MMTARLPYDVFLACIELGVGLDDFDKWWEYAGPADTVTPTAWDVSDYLHVRQQQ